MIAASLINISYCSSTATAVQNGGIDREPVALRPDLATMFKPNAGKFYGKTFSDLYEAVQKSLPEDPVRVLITYDQPSSESFLQAIRSRVDLNLKINYVCKYIPVVACELPAGKLKELENFKEVQALWLDKPKYLASLDGLESRLSRIDFLTLQRSYIDSERLCLNDSARIIGAQSLWDVGVNGSGVTIAFIDTGINKTHPDFYFPDGKSKIIKEVSFVPNEDPMDYYGHGTHCAGIAAGTGVASKGKFKGIAPGASLMNIKIFSKRGFTSDEWILAALEYVIDVHPDIISMSWGGPAAPESDPVNALVKEIVKRGIIAVAAAGNNAYYWSVESPGNTASVISVGATTKNNRLASFSSRGPDAYSIRNMPTIVAPGVNIVAPKSGLLGQASELAVPGYPEYIMLSGTSMAVPHVAGAVALLLERFPLTTPTTAQVALIKSADDIGYDENAQGAGLINVYKAYDAISNAPIRGSELSTETAPSQLSGIENAGSLPSSDLLSLSQIPPSENYALFRNEYLSFIVTDNFRINWMAYSGVNHFRQSLPAFRYDNFNFFWSNSSGVKIIKPFTKTIDTTELQQGEGIIFYKTLTVKLAITLKGGSKTCELRYSISSSGALSNIALYQVVDMNMDGFSFNSGQHVGGLDAVIAWSSHYFGITGEKISSAYDVGDESLIFKRVENDALANTMSSIGSLAGAMKWMYSTSLPAGKEWSIACYYAFGDRRFETTYALGTMTNRHIHDIAVTGLRTAVSANPNSSVRITTEIANLGEFTENEVPIYLYVLDAANNTIASYEKILPIFMSDTTEEVVFTHTFLKDGFYQFLCHVGPVGGEVDTWNNRVSPWRIRVGPLRFMVGMFLGRITGIESPYVARFPGDIDYFNVTIITSNSLFNLRAAISGNASQITYITRQVPGTIDTFGYVSVQVSIPSNAKVGWYTGALQLISATNVVTQIPIRIEVVKPISTVIWDDVHDYNMGWQYLWAYYITLWQSVSTFNVRVIPASLMDGASFNELTKYDAILFVDPYYGFGSDFVNAVLGYVAKGGCAIFVCGRRSLQMRSELRYDQILKYYGISIVADKYSHWSNSSKPMASTHLALGNASMFTVVQGVTFNVNPPSQVLAKSVDVGWYSLTSNYTFTTAAIYDGNGGLGKVFAFASDYALDDSWIEVQWKIQWIVSGGVPRGFVITDPTFVPQNKLLATAFTYYASNKPPIVLSVASDKNSVLREFDKITIKVQATDAETPAAQLRAQALFNLSDGSSFTTWATYSEADNTFIIKYSPPSDAPVGTCNVAITVFDQVGASAATTTSFLIFDQTPIWLILSLFIAILSMSYVVRVYPRSKVVRAVRKLYRERMKRKLQFGD